MLRIKIKAICPALFGFALTLSSSHASPEAQMGPHGGRVLSNGTRTAEIRIEEKSQTVDVFVSPYKGGESNSVHVTLHDSKKQPVTVVLKAVSGSPGDTGHFQGSLGSSVDRFGILKTSAMGIEIRIPFTQGKDAVLKSSPQ